MVDPSEVLGQQNQRVFVHLLHVLNVLWTGRRVPDELPRSSNLLICVGSQKHALVEIPHGQHVLFVLLVQGFAGGGEGGGGDLVKTPTQQPTPWRYHRALLVLNEVLWIQQLGQVLLVPFKDLFRVSTVFNETRL